MRFAARRFNFSAIPASIAVLVALIAAPSDTAAQGQDPLLKSDIVRLLTTSALSRDEIAALISRNCLAFEPTVRDREDFRNLGADDSIMRAIEGCGGRARTVQVAPAQPRVTARAGGVATLTVRVTRAGQPVEGVELALRGTGALPGGRGTDARAFSSSSGAALFRVPVGTAPGTYPLTIGATGDDRIEGNTSLVLMVRSATAARVELRPDRLQTQRGSGPVELTVVLRDSFGNVVAGQNVELRPASTAMGISEEFKSTDSRGEVIFTVDSDLLRQSGTVGIYVGSERLASVPVTLAAGAASAEQTRFIAGVDQSGAVGITLPRPLVLEVRDEFGLPVVGQQVVFTASNARVEPPLAITDTAGIVSVTVQLGTSARPATVAALIEGRRIEATLRVVAGPATRLSVTMNGAPIESDLLIDSDEPFLLQVSAQDAYGNIASVAGLRTTVENERALRLVGVSADSLGARVALEPLSDGVTAVTVEASGLRENFTAQLLFSQRPYFTGYTHLYGSGLIVTPHADIAPASPDVHLIAGAALQEASGARFVDASVSLVFSLLRRVEIGITNYSPIEWGFPVKLQLLAPGRVGLSFAVGALNAIPTSDNMNRQGIDGPPGPSDGYIDRASPYLVGSFSRRATGSPVGFLVSIGWGAGMFREKSPGFSDKGYTHGFFGAAGLDAVASPGAVFRLMLEHDGWDTHAAGTLMFHGIEVTLGMLSLDEAGGGENSDSLDRMRFFFRLGVGLKSSSAWLGF